jgi:hypothetical protein
MNKYKLIIGVISCYTIPKYISQIEAINNSWGKLCINNVKLLFFLGEIINSNFTGEQYINLPSVKDDYMSASHKQFLGMKYIHENYDTEFVILFGSDTYLNIPKLLQYLNNFDPRDNLYIGGHGCVRNIGDRQYYFHSGGPGFIVSQYCLQKIYPYLNDTVENWINVCKTNNVEYLLASCDVAVSYYLQQENVNTTIIKTNDLSFIHCNHNGYTCHIGEVKKEEIISCHNMSINDFYDFTKLLEENNYYMDTPLKPLKHTII